MFSSYIYTSKTIVYYWVSELADKIFVINRHLLKKMWEGGDVDHKIVAVSLFIDFRDLEGIGEIFIPQDPD